MQIFSARTPVIHDHALADTLATLLADRLADIKRKNFARALWCGAGDPGKLEALKTIDTLEARPFPVEGDIEHFPSDEASLDLIVVNGALNTINDLPGVLIQIRRALKPDGLFLCALTGGETLYELRACLAHVETNMRGGAATRIHPMIDLQTFAALMQRAGFALPVADADIHTIYYRELKTLLRDIKRSGEGLRLKDRDHPYVGRHFWAEVAREYHARHASHDGLLKASVEVISAIGWGPSDAQQKPLRPGSAENRLADALGATETSLPDPARPH